MKTYIGTKIVKLQAMTRGEYNDYRGWAYPAGEDQSAQGYLVEYTDGGKPNDDRHAGYISWTPKEQADAAYRPTDGMSFGLALEALKKGARVARTGWNGKGMFVVLMPRLQLPPYSTQGTERKVNDRTAKWIGEDTPLDCSPYLAMWTADRKWQPGWLASQADMLADDWQIVGSEA